MNERNAKELLEKYRAGHCTDEERAIIENWYARLGQDISPDDEVVLDTKQRVWLSLSSRLFSQWKPLWKQLAVAGLLLLCLSAGTLYYYHNYFEEAATVAVQPKAGQDEIVPGGRVAILTLSDGSQISLDDVGQGSLAIQGSTDIVKMDNGQIAYQVNGELDHVGLNVLQTPRGGQYQVTLSDGTKVWLNAESSITYPTAFNGSERRVEVTGEVYFEVAHRKDQPFHVRSGHQEISVLGTHFNVEAYENEGETRTTLLEGSVRVIPIHLATSIKESENSGKILKPRQQAVMRAEAGHVEVSDVNPDDVVAWKNGLFVFNSESLESVMRKIARWYNVDVVYVDNQPKEEFFGGSVSRFDQVSTILEMLEKTGDVRFRVEGKQIFVYAGRR